MIQDAKIPRSAAQDRPEGPRWPCVNVRGRHAVEGNGEGTKMKLSRRYSLVLGLAAALSQGCGGDSAGTGPGGNNTGGSGSGGSGNAAPGSCTPTKCTGDPQYSVWTQDACDAAEKA